MNNKGQVGLAIISAVMIFMVGMVTVNLLKPEITNARETTALDCQNNSITDGTKLTCLVVDFTVPYFMIIIFSVVGGILVGFITGGKK